MIRRIFILPYLFISFSLLGQKTDSFPKSTPEAEGVSSAGILSFIHAVENSKNEFHSFMMLRHGKVIAQGWWDPYKPSLRHSMYSASKTFTSTAIGFAVSENRLKLTDQVISFFPKDLPDSVSPNLAALTIRDLLIMSVGQDPDPTTPVRKSKNWVKAFLATPVLQKPGTVFLYNSTATFMLSAILQKVTGQKLLDYLKPRLFEPLGITGIDWEENLMGVNTGGWGLRIKTEDMAKIGQLYLQKGKWNGTQVLPAAWIEEATTEKIFRNPLLEKAKKDSSDWDQGYGFQIWRSRHHSYRADGAFGQYILVLPDQDVVIAIQEETPEMQSALNLVWNYLLPAIKKNKLQADPKSLAALDNQLNKLSLKPEPGDLAVRDVNKSVNRYYILEPNESQISTVTLNIRDSICQLAMNTGNDVYNLYYGAGFWKIGQTNRSGPSLVSDAKENFALLSPYKVAGNFYWIDNQTLVMELRYIESPHSEKFIFHFDGKNVSIEMEKSFQFGSQKTTLTGVLK